MKRAKILFVLLCAATITYSQQAATNFGNLKIHAGGSISFHTNFTNASTANLINDGSLNVKAGLISNQAGMNQGTGTLTFSGSSAQAVSGSQAFKTFNLVTNNTSGLTLNVDLSVYAHHTFTNGVINTSATPTYLVYEAGASYSGNGDGRHINGWAKKIGATNFTFPIGNASIQRTVTLEALSGSSVFAAKYNSATPNASQLSPPLVSLDQNEYWNIQKVSGGTANVRLNWDNSKVPFPDWSLPEVAVASFNGSTWASIGGTATGNAATTGMILSNSTSVFGPFTFASSAFTLPLTLLSFDAKLLEKHVSVQWRTTNERNINYFDVERSDDGRSFYSIKKESGRNSARDERYEVGDFKPINLFAFYRLAWYDLDGTIKRSGTVRVAANVESPASFIIANPVSDKLRLISQSGYAGSYQYAVINEGGQIIQNGKVTIALGTSNEILLARRFPAGSYVLLLTNEKQTLSRRFIIQ